MGDVIPFRGSLVLAEEQRKALKGITSHLCNPRNQVALLTGISGSGKTELMVRIGQECQRREGMPLCLVAPTHAALKVAQKRFEGAKVELSGCMTLARLLGTRPDKTLPPPPGRPLDAEFESGVGDTKAFMSILSQGRDVGSPPLFVFDEVSMVSEADVMKIKGLLDIYQERGVARFKVLFVGDFNQLPPVNEKSAEQFLSRIGARFHLGHCHRSDGTQINEVGERILRGEDISARPPARGVIYYDDARAFEAQFAAAAKAQEKPWALAWRNATVNTYNRVGRIAAGKDGLSFEVGDFVRVDAPIFYTPEGGGLHGPTPFCTTGDVLELERADPVHSFSLPWVDGSFEVQKIDFPGMAELRAKIPYPEHLIVFGYTAGDKADRTSKIHQVFEQHRAICSDLCSFVDKHYPPLSGYQTFQRLLKTFVGDRRPEFKTLVDYFDIGGLADKYASEARQAGLVDRIGAQNRLRRLIWGRAYHGLVSRFIPLTHEFASTTHKAQGGERDVVFVDLRDIQRNPDHAERRALQYVAITRAKREAHVLLSTSDVKYQDPGDCKLGGEEV